MATYELNLTLDRSIPFVRLKGFPRTPLWPDVETVATTDRSIAVRITMNEELAGASSRWDATYAYGVTTETDAEGNPVFAGFPDGQVDVASGVLECTLKPGKNYIRVERDGGTVRDWRRGEFVIGSSVWSKAKVSGYMIVEVA